MSYLTCNNSNKYEKNQIAIDQTVKENERNNLKDDVSLKEIHIFFKILFFLIKLSIDPTGQCYFIMCLISKIINNNHKVRMLNNRKDRTKETIFFLKLKINHHNRRYEFEEKLKYFRKLEYKTERKKASHEIDVFENTIVLEEEVPNNNQRYISDRQFDFNDLLDFFNRKL